MRGISFRCSPHGGNGSDCGRRPLCSSSCSPPLFVLRVDGIFEEPKPLDIWQDPVPSAVRLQSWKEKSYGQWYFCCGENNTECCLGLQTWTFVVFGSLIVLALIICLLSVLAYYDFLFANEKPKKISSKRYSSVVTGANV
ncbi:hypothetical protein M3Y99_00171200 [Aphelenchoides fujianensis]|nr:hypothetical protein M3Y99_00171200 [Aphelenchoides fujianensis]